jgi:hypothetical protein
MVKNSNTYKIAQFIPILLLFFFISYSESMASFSHSSLGKLFAIAMILFYTYLDTYVGLAVCAFVLLFYQMNIVENSLNPLTVEEPSDIEKFVNYEEEYPEESSEKETSAQLLFREQYCKDGKLNHKGMVVKPDMAEHVFPELKFAKEKCNPCLPSCKFSIIESKLQTQEALTPKLSKP